MRAICCLILLRSEGKLWDAAWHVSIILHTASRCLSTWGLVRRPCERRSCLLASCICWLFPCSLSSMWCVLVHFQSLIGCYRMLVSLRLSVNNVFLRARFLIIERYHRPCTFFFCCLSLVIELLLRTHISRRWIAMTFLLRRPFQRIHVHFSSVPHCLNVIRLNCTRVMLIMNKGAMLNDWVWVGVRIIQVCCFIEDLTLLCSAAFPWDKGVNVHGMNIGLACLLGLLLLGVEDVVKLGEPWPVVVLEKVFVHFLELFYLLLLGLNLLLQWIFRLHLAVHIMFVALLLHYVEEIVVRLR